MLLREKLETTRFSSSERNVANYLLETGLDLEKQTINAIASACYTVPSTLVRVAQKLGFSGWKDLKSAYLQEERYLQQHFLNIDANRPFRADDSIMQVASKLETLKEEALRDTLDLLEYPALQQASDMLRKARQIHLFGISHNPLLAGKFAYDMRRIHKSVIGHTMPPDFLFDVRQAGPEDCVLVISYTGESVIINEVLKACQEKHIPTIALTSIGENETSRLADCVLRIATREKIYSKIGSFCTDTSVVYLLELLYACVFKVHYERNLQEKIRLSKATETRTHVDNQILKEDGTE